MRRPASSMIRDWLVRLRPLARPVIWVPMSLIGLGLLVMAQQESNPDWLEGVGQSQSPNNSDLSAEDQAIGADIDNLPLLLNDFGLLQLDPPEERGGQPKRGATKPTPNLPSVGVGAKSPAAASLGLLAGLSNGPVNPATQPVDGWGNPIDANNAPLGEILNPLPAGSSSRLGTGTPMGTSALATALAQSQIRNTASGNQNGAINQPAISADGRLIPTINPTNGGWPLPLDGTTSVNRNQPSNNPPLEGTTSLNPSGVGVPLSPNSNAFGSLTGNQPLPNSGLVPTVPTSNLGPVIAPNQLESQPSSSNFIGGNSLNSTPNSQGQPLPQNPQPFSVPRPIPGRSIGGGQINTFSNP
jgi:hypothetical protein